ncbi:RadC family protein [Devosia aurantiaca]|uniref:JAB domain-containing protein n=1 Tax=Devosia aurantiaca TaxID=2714858 RepID=A0A6M1SMH9_9HYPH|nr:DNA repair protein RadC [Devosia aurantiaca]NGP17904.1 JAB domain-containing protein [Devosia aurantiaca]
MPKRPDQLGEAPFQPLDDDVEAVTTPKPVDDHKGHRERVRQRFLKAGGEAFEDYELLEMVLFLAIPYKDTKPLAKALLREFGSFSAVFSASHVRLSKFPGLSASSAANLKVIQSVAARFAREGIADDKPILASWSQLLDYFRSQMAFETVEQFRILFLDKKNRLIADEVQQVGTVDHTPVYPREVIKRSLELSATALILVHNHPSGDPAPSSADIRMTREIADIAKPLGIVLHDHIIVGKSGHASLRGLKLI